MKKYYLLGILFISLILINGCTKSTSVMFKVEEGNMKFEGFGRGQSILNMMCSVCPHVGAKVEIKSLNEDLICKGSNEIIVDSTDSVKFKVKCSGLENHENERVKLYAEGFAGGKIEPITEFKIEEEVLVEFEKLKR